MKSNTNPTTFSRFLFHHNLTFSPPPSLPNVADLWQANGTPSWSSSKALRKEAPLPEINGLQIEKCDLSQFFPAKKRNMEPENHLPLEMENHLPSNSFFLRFKILVFGSVLFGGGRIPTSKRHTGPYN